MLNALALRIKDKITAEGASAHSFEKQAGLKTNAVRNILNGRSKNPSIEILHRIAKTLNCTVSELIGEELPPKNDEDLFAVDKFESNENTEFYILCLSYFCSLLKKNRLWLSREKIFNYSDELYMYSLKKGGSKIDKHFANWLIEKGKSKRGDI